MSLCSRTLTKLGSTVLHRTQAKAGWGCTLQELYRLYVLSDNRDTFPLMRGTLFPARRRRAVPGSSGCGRAAQYSLASDPLCPCRAASNPPLRTAPCSGFAPFSPQSSGPGSSSCCGLAAEPMCGVWLGTTPAAVVGRPL